MKLVKTGFFVLLILPIITGNVFFFREEKPPLERESSKFSSVPSKSSSRREASEFLRNSHHSEPNEAAQVRDELNKLLGGELKRKLAQREKWCAYAQSDLKRDGAGFSRDKKILSAVLEGISEDLIDEILVFWKKAQIDSRNLGFFGYESIDSFAKLSDFENFLMTSSQETGETADNFIFDYFEEQGKAEISRKYPKLELAENKTRLGQPLESEMFMKYISESLPEYAEVLDRLQVSAHQIYSEKKAYAKLHECTYSTYLSDQQRQQLLDLFIREPDLDIEEAMKKVIPN